MKLFLYVFSGTTLQDQNGSSPSSLKMPSCNQPISHTQKKFWKGRNFFRSFVDVLVSNTRISLLGDAWLRIVAILDRLLPLNFALAFLTISLVHAYYFTAGPPHPPSPNEDISQQWALPSTVHYYFRFTIGVRCSAVKRRPSSWSPLSRSLFVTFFIYFKNYPNEKFIRLTLFNIRLNIRRMCKGFLNIHRWISKCFQQARPAVPSGVASRRGHRARHVPRAPATTRQSWVWAGKEDRLEGSREGIIGVWPEIRLVHNLHWYNCKCMEIICPRRLNSHSGDKYVVRNNSRAWGGSEIYRLHSRRVGLEHGGDWEALEVIGMHGRLRSTRLEDAI